MIGRRRTLHGLVLTLNEPARFDPYALPVLVGAAAAALAVARAPRLRALPLPAVLFFVFTIAAALVARGSAYSGRVSLHAIPITCALCVGAIYRVGRPGPQPTHVQLEEPIIST